jgi:hypothetical protein
MSHLKLVMRAYWQLIVFDLYLSRGSFRALYDRVRTCPIGRAPHDPEAVKHICYAVDIACIWYRKEVLCLQRSAATTCLLRNHGVAASMIIGAQQLPFRAHAWVEVDGAVVNDKPYVPDLYAVLDRC